MNTIYDEPYPSFDLRRDEPERHQSVLNPPQPPLVDADPWSVVIVCAIAVIALAVLTGFYVAIPERLP